MGPFPWLYRFEVAPAGASFAAQRKKRWERDFVRAGGKNGTHIKTHSREGSASFS